jgi:hypothetical protein
MVDPILKRKRGAWCLIFLWGIGFSGWLADVAASSEQIVIIIHGQSKIPKSLMVFSFLVCNIRYGEIGEELI